MSQDKNKSEIQTRNENPTEITSHERDFDRMLQKLEDEFEDFVTPRWRSLMRDFPMPSMRMPSLDLEDRGKDFRVTADLPGFKKEDVNIEITDDSLVIRARRSQAEEDKNKNYVRRERTAQTFYRQVMLPEKINSDNAQAKLSDGTLEIILPKREPKQVKTLTPT